MKAGEVMRVFDLVWPRLRTVAAFAIGVFLVTKPSLSATQATIGAACLGITGVGVLSELIIWRNGNGKGKKE